MASIEKSGDRWYVRFWEEINGKKKRVRIPKGGCDSYADAKKILDSIENTHYKAKMQGYGVIDHEKPVIELWDQYIEACRNGTAGKKKRLPYADKTIDTKIVLATQSFLPHFKTLKSLNKRAIEEWYDQLCGVVCKSGFRKGQTYSHDYIGNQVRVFKAFISWLRRRDYLQTDPAFGISAGSPKSGGQHLEKKTLYKLLECAPDRLYPLLRTLIETGARPGEVLKMKYSHLRGNDWEIPKEDTKTRKARRYYLSDSVINSIGEMRVGDFVFGAYTHMKLYGDWQKTKKRAGVSMKVRMYDMRHTFATDFAMHEKDLHALMEVMGWQDAKTARNYKHLTTEYSYNKQKNFNHLPASSDAKEGGVFFGPPLVHEDQTRREEAL